MNADERIDALLALPELDSEFIRITRIRRPKGGMGYELKLFRSAPVNGGIYFFGDTVHEALCSAEAELISK